MKCVSSFQQLKGGHAVPVSTYQVFSLMFQFSGCKIFLTVVFFWFSKRCGSQNLLLAMGNLLANWNTRRICERTKDFIEHLVVTSHDHSVPFCCVLFCFHPYGPQFVLGPPLTITGISVLIWAPRRSIYKPGGPLVIYIPRLWWKSRTKLQ